MLTRETFVDALENVDDVGQHYAFIDTHARQGELSILRDLFLELRELQPKSALPGWALASLMERIVEALALTDGFHNAATALELTAVAQSPGVDVVRVALSTAAAVSKVVAAQSPVVIDSLLSKVNDLETAALVLHEAIIRGKLMMESAAVSQEIHNRLVIAKHPLASLPMTLFDMEDGVDLPDYHLGASSTCTPYGPAPDESVMSLAPSAGDVEVSEITSAERATRISAAVRNWADESNGKIEARTFRIEQAVCDGIETILPRLGLESLRPTDVVRSRQSVTAKEAFSLVFSAASNGGAYNAGAYAAYGRLLAWQSLAGLVGASVDASIPEIVLSSRNCQWCIFDSPNEWYYQVVWDIGIACFNPARRELAILSATDTD